MATHGAPLDRAEAKRLEGWLRRGAKPGQRALYGAIAMGGLSGLLLVAQCRLLAGIVNGAVLRHAPWQTAWPALAGLLGLLGARFFLGMAGERLGFAASVAAASALRARLASKLAALGPGYINAQRGGALSALLTDAPEQLAPYVRTYLPQSALSVFLPAAFLVFVFPTDWISGIIMLLSAPLIPVFMIIVGKGAASLNRQQWRRLARLSAHLFDVIGGLTTLKLFGLSRLQGRIVAQMSEQYRQSVMAVLRVAFLSALVLEFFATLSIAMIAVYIGFRLYYGEMAFLPGFFVLLLAPEFYKPLREMGTQYHVRLEALAAAEQVVAFLDTAEPAVPVVSAALPPGPVRRIELQGVGFGYDPACPVLRDVSFSIGRGERVALIGPSGGGKSSLARLLLGLERPQAGRILLDGVDLAGLAPADWFARVSWLPQSPVFFRGTVAEIMRLGHPGASLSELRSAAALAGAAGFIEALPDGYDTVIGEQGQGLSGGEVRRLALARALLKPADLLILDEPDASLDALSATQVASALAAVAPHCAILFIAHRMEGVALADRVVRLEAGRVQAQGAPALLGLAGVA